MNRKAVNRDKMAADWEETRKPSQDAQIKEDFSYPGDGSKNALLWGCLHLTVFQFN